VFGPSVEIEIGMGGFAVHSVAQRAVRSPINNLCPGRGGDPNFRPLW
jgi:hypothetical protein